MNFRLLLQENKIILCILDVWHDKFNRFCKILINYFSENRYINKVYRFRTRGWMSVSGAAPHVELCCKKVGDGHPLRLWRATTDIEAPPQEVMQR